MGLSIHLSTPSESRDYIKRAYAQGALPVVLYPFHQATLMALGTQYSTSKEEG